MLLSPTFERHLPPTACEFSVGPVFRPSMEIGEVDQRPRQWRRQSRRVMKPVEVLVKKGPAQGRAGKALEGGQANGSDTGHRAQGTIGGRLGVDSDAAEPANEKSRVRFPARSAFRSGDQISKRSVSGDPRGAGWVVLVNATRSGGMRQRRHTSRCLISASLRWPDRRRIRCHGTR